MVYKLADRKYILYLYSSKKPMERLHSLECSLRQAHTRLNMKELSRKCTILINLRIGSVRSMETLSNQSEKLKYSEKS